MHGEQYSNQLLMALQAMDLSNHYGTMSIATAALAGGAAYYYLQNRTDSSSYRTPLIDFKNQSKLVSNRTDNARICTLNKTDEPIDIFHDNCTTLYEVFLRSKKLAGSAEYLGWKPASNEPYKWYTYDEAFDLSRQLGSAFLRFGVKPSDPEAFVGIYAQNRPEWIITEQACNMFSMIVVPLYDTLGTESMEYILSQTELKVMVCDDSIKALSLLKLKSKLETIVLIDDLTDEVRERASEANVKVFRMTDLYDIGKSSLAEPVPPKIDDVCTICYTSGTTGVPKGAIMTHRNLVSVASTVMVIVNRTLDLNEQQRYISYLPLAHMYERSNQVAVVMLCGAIGFYEGDIKKLVDNIKEIKPTIFATVPRLLNRMYAKIQDNLSKKSAITRKIFHVAYAQKEKEVLNGINRSNGMWDFAFKQIRASFGGNLKYMFTGSAPVSPDILHFLRVCCGCYVLEGYGATETTGPTSLQLPGSRTVGDVGPPMLCSMVKLIDVPEMNLSVDKDKKGEILLKGSNVFKGYYKNEEKTRECLDDDGWYHSGDIGSFTEDGCLKIVDRVKNIFKLSQGEYVAPEKIENVYAKCKYIAQMFLYGDSYKSSVIAIVVPDEATLVREAKDMKLDMDFKDLCNNKVIKDMIMKDMDRLAKQADLKSFEKVRDIYLCDVLFSIENGLLTPTMKSKRNELKAHFSVQIKELYKNLD